MAKFSLILFSLVIFISITEIASQELLPSKCVKPSLENGNVTVKNRGRAAKFRCRRGFSRFDGAKVATCIRQRWNKRIPKCISPGCPSLTPPRHGGLAYEKQQSVARVNCDPGYTLTGHHVITCNSSVWNATVPACQASYTTPRLVCTFEGDTCGWSNSPDNNYFWELKSAASLHLSHKNNFPATDHTLGTAAGMFMIASANPEETKMREGSSATLYSPVFKAANKGVACLNFFYYINDEHDEGKLLVLFKPQDRRRKFVTPVFESSSRSHASWVRQKLVFTNVTQPFQILIRSLRGIVVAIDDVKVNYDTLCTVPTCSP